MCVAGVIVWLDGIVGGVFGVDCGLLVMSLKKKKKRVACCRYCCLLFAGVVLARCVSLVVYGACACWRWCVPLDVVGVLGCCWCSVVGCCW